MNLVNKKIPSIHTMTIPETGMISFGCQDIKQHFIRVYPPRCGDPMLIFKQLAKYVQDNDIKILSQFVFGGPEMNIKDLSEIESCLEAKNWPITYLHGDIPTNGLLYGTQVYSVSGSNCTPVYLNSKIVGSCYEDKNAEYCFLGDIRPGNNNLSRVEQTQETFDNIKKALETIGMDFSHVIRTWFYLDKLLEWYSEFNAVRTKFFSEQGVFNNLVPASTGIGEGNLQEAALVTNVLAVKPKHAGVHVIPVPSPMQCEATDYKSSFSRAVEIQFPDNRQLYISGTASIDDKGNSIHVGNITGQIEQTMEVVRKIIESRSMNWCDVVRSIAYFKDIKHLPLFYDYCQRNHLPPLPVSYCQSDICRQDLLFEIEIDSISINA